MPPRCSTIQWRLIVSSIRRRPRRLIPINRAAVTATIPPTMTVARTFNLFGAGPVDNQGRWWLTPGAACRNEGTRVMPAPDIVGRPVLLWRLEHASHPPTECVSLVSSETAGTTFAYSATAPILSPIRSLMPPLAFGGHSNSNAS